MHATLRIFAAAIMLTLAALSTSLHAESKKPNIVYIMADDK